MDCPTCQHENPAEARFCMHCAASLIPACAGCGAELPAAARFCPQCAHPVGTVGFTPEAVADRHPREYTPHHLIEKILSSRAALEGERKQVTVFFADVKGSTELAGRFDPEEWHRILDRFFQILTEGVHRFEGTVNQYTGDGIMALFGAPIAHEDHAQRACYAALHLKQRLRDYAQELRRERGLDFQTRIGLNSGVVVVGKIGDDLRMDYTAQGHVVHLAKRMEQLAEAGCVYLAPETVGLVEGYFELANLGEFKLKGAEAPTPVHELRGTSDLRVRLDISRARGFSRFVGRSGEFATLVTALERATEGYGQVVGVVGEAGVGKSRLCLEFVEHARRLSIPVFEAHCPAHCKAVPFLPLLELLRSFFDLSERDGEHEARRKIAGELLLLDRDFDEALPLVFDFLGVPDPERPALEMDAGTRRRQLYAFVRHLVHCRSARGLSLLLVDDLHWIDAGSDAFVAQLVEAVTGTRTMLLVNFRPEYQAAWTSRAHYQQLPLAPLGPEAICELLRELLGESPSIAGLPERISERTRGNPFFIEEVVQSLVESEAVEGTRGAYRLVRPVEVLEIPTRVQPVLAARIDRLAEREKHVLQVASVIGKLFAEPVLRRVVALPDPDLTAALAALQEADFVRQETIYPEVEYAFKHPLTHQVALESQLSEPRARAHEAAARALEEVHADRLDEQAGLLAHHWEQAGQAADAARWYARAADWVGETDPAEAMRNWRRVRELLGPETESPDSRHLAVLARVHIFQLGLWIGGIEPKEVEAIFEEARALTDRAADPALLGRLMSSYLWLKPTLIPPTPRDLQLCEETLRLAEELDDDLLFAEMASGYYSTMLFSGNPQKGCDVLSRALARWNQGDEKEIPPDLFFIRGYTLMEMGRLAEAREDLRQFAELTRDSQDVRHIVGSVFFFATIECHVGNREAQITQARQAVELAEKVSFGWYVAASQLWLGDAALRAGEWTEAANLLEEGLRIIREERVIPFWEPIGRAWLAEARLGLGNIDEAVKIADEVVQREIAPLNRIEVLVPCARVQRLARGAAARTPIEALLEEASGLVADTGFRVYGPGIHEERAALAHLLGDASASQRELRNAHKLYTEIGATGHADRVARELGQAS